ncbi:phospholipase A2, membrane associated-like isoform X1 [Pezoporus flaviventris]|uniref:phospholipase A2, membrane associated-like isoform X1 n=1 Tax=Pezoporus flaviventris TaxID=889875 RepID=UPI002AAF787F|nr:phospholipase A2, membrane associated-like isoform X1 [Pezoporus flaviventris]
MLYVHGNTNVTVLRAPGAGVVASVLCLGYCSLPPVAVSSSRTALRMKNLLFTLLLACGLLPAHSSVLELEQMIRAATGRSALLSYSWYGCFCGIGGRGTPVDSTDQCCHAHDCCYKKLSSSRCSPKLVTYKYSIQGSKITCGERRHGAKGTNTHTSPPRCPSGHYPGLETSWGEGGKEGKAPGIGQINVSWEYGEV